MRIFSWLTLARSAADRLTWRGATLSDWLTYCLLPTENSISCRPFDPCTTTCRIPKGQHAVGLITGHNSLQAIEAALAEISHFLCASAVIAVLIDSRESGVSLKIRAKLEQMGFRIEAGVRCREGFVLSAVRQDFGQMQNAA